MSLLGQQRAARAVLDRIAKGNRVELTLIVPMESQARMQMDTVVQEDLAKLGIKLQIAPATLSFPP